MHYPVNLQPIEFFEDLFVNDSEDGLNRFWREVDFEGISDSSGRIFKAAEHFAKEGKDQVNFRSFTGIIVVTDINIGLTGTSRRMFNLNGETLPYRVVICDQETTHTMIAHEMGHSFGLNHSCNGNPKSCSPSNDGTPGAYCDSWDIMSADLVDSFESPRFGNSGPLLNAVNINFLGWLNESRVIEASGNTYNRGLCSNGTETAIGIQTP